MARAVLVLQRERMAEVLDGVTPLPWLALERILELFERPSVLVATDALIQAGIHLSMQPASAFKHESRAPYLEWSVGRGARSRSRTDSGLISPMMRVCESVTKRSSSRCISRGVAR